MRTVLFFAFGGLTLLSVAAARWSVTAGFAVALLAAVIGAFIAPWLFSRSFRDVIGFAQRLARGDMTARSTPMPFDRLLPLGRALDQVAESLSRAMTDLRTERDVLSRILDRMEEGVMVIDGDRRIVRINPALTDMLFPRPALAASGSLESGDRRSRTGEIPSLLDVRGKTVLEVFRHADLVALLDHVQVDGRVKGEIEIAGLKPRRLMVRAIGFAQAQRGCLVVIDDVTDIRRLESLRRDFVANVSHELLTPVAAVRSGAETMRVAMTRDPQSVERFIDIIERNAERLHDLVKDLLELSRIESREFHLVLEDIALDRLVEGILSLFKIRAEARRISLRFTAVGEPAAFVTDRRAIEMVLSNLVDNAVKYCPEGATVTVQLSVEAGRATLAVSDTGPGIAKEHLPRLFERFYRIDPGRSRDRGGTGLGLSIVKHLVEALGGVASVNSVVGQGTSFTVSLPRRPAAASAGTAP